MATKTAVRVTEFTDPGCPFAYSAEPQRRRLQWTFGDQLDWQTRLVVLAQDGEEYVAKGFTPERQAASFEKIAERHGMPFDLSRRPRMAATAPACRAVVGARLHAPGRETRLLRELRLQAMAGPHLLDEDDTLRAAAVAADLDPEDVVLWARCDDEVAEATRDDCRSARDPLPAAMALEHKLADWDGGKRYTCPSLELAAQREIALPGFQPFETYDAALANLDPDLERRPAPDHVDDVLRWAGEPLATAEVAAVLGVDREQAREQLRACADEHPAGTDAFWTPR